ncbi:hypothetical protein LCGC14_0661420 [marine sediment metagenome]|uniref:Uncharacterized protein n=1 Tax=marine sediment metagenome TaxID=412755 RepID=A0A0F9QYG2_9ZZZZ
MKKLKLEDQLQCHDISGEQSRTYTISGIDTGVISVICIKHPQKLFCYKNGHAFHRVYAGTTMHLAPVPGFIWGKCGKITGYCEVTWVPKDPKNPCKF